MDIKEFYEGKFIKSHINPFDKNVFYKLFGYIFINAKRWKVLHSFLKGHKHKKTVLDFGCGGGNELLASFNTIGVDISSTSLENASKIYDKVILLEPDKPLGIENHSIDIIVSTDVIGHLSKQEKDIYLKEFSRILKNNGEVFFMAEMDCDLHLFKFAKQYPHLYKKHFIEEDGHFGLETFEGYKDTFHRYGFKIITFQQNCGDMFWTLEEYLKRFNNEYRKKSPILSLFISTLLIIKKLKLKYLFDFTISILDYIYSRFSNKDNSTSGFFILTRDN